MKIRAIKVKASTAVPLADSRIANVEVEYSAELEGHDDEIVQAQLLIEYAKSAFTSEQTKALGEVPSEEQKVTNICTKEGFLEAALAIEVDGAPFFHNETAVKLAMRTLGYDGFSKIQAVAEERLARLQEYANG